MKKFRTLFAYSYFLVSSLCGCMPSSRSPAPQRDNLSVKVSALLNRYGEVRVTSCTTRIDEILRRVILSSDPIVTVRVLDTLKPMALSPGNRTILVSRGLLQLLPTEGQAAFMLAHELSHYALGHVDAVLTTDESLDSDARKELELAADSAGLIRLVEGGYEPTEALASLKVVYQAVRREFGRGSPIEDYPSLPARIDALAQAVLAARMRGPGTTDRREWQRCRGELVDSRGR